MQERLPRRLGCGPHERRINRVRIAASRYDVGQHDLLEGAECSGRRESRQFPGDPIARSDVARVLGNVRHHARQRRQATPGQRPQPCELRRPVSGATREDDHPANGEGLITPGTQSLDALGKAGEVVDSPFHRVDACEMRQHGHVVGIELERAYERGA
jgi:hypothetical protein